VFLAEVEHATGRPGAPLAYFRGQFGRLELAQDEQAFRDIRARVMSRRLPVGQPLDLDSLGQLVGVPRGSVYHAMTKLSGVGLTSRTDDGRFTVTPLTIDAVADGLEARRSIELGVAANTVGRLSRTQLDQLGDAVERTRPADEDGSAAQLDVEEQVKRYREFHDFFVSLAGSFSLVDAHRRVDTAAMIMSVTGDRAVAQHAIERAAERAYRHHRRLLDAYEAGDLDAAIETIRGHIDESLVFTRRYVESVGGEV
jgi:4-nitrophenol 2-monooxygenase / 4-nitrocatechol 4-monooxygenase, reductase component